MKNRILLNAFLIICACLSVLQLNANPADWNNDNNHGLNWQLDLESSLKYDGATTPSEVVALACKPSIQVSLNQLGYAVITPSMLVSGPEFPLNQYEVDIMGPLNDTVYCSQIGQELMGVLEALPTGNTCMSMITVEDKLKPTLICEGDTLACNVDIDTINFANFIELVEDNCDDDVDLTYAYSITSVDCNPDNIVAFIKVDWTATDNFNNSTTCSDTIFLEKPSIDDVVFPNDTTLNCVNADPSPEVLGGPTVLGGPIDHTCKFVAWNIDNVIPMCNGMRKIIRVWNVMDWCTGETRSDMQEILIEDDTPPMLVCPSNTNISTNVLNCVADYILVPPVSVSDDCSDEDLIEIEIFVQGVPGIFAPGDVVELPLGATLITIRATDDCQNSGTCSYTVNVVDDVDPIAVCSDINISIAQSGMAFIIADTLPFNPQDNCGVLDVEIARMEDRCATPENLVFGEEVKFCCEDVEEINMVAYKVTDINGNMTTCMFQVNVKDVLPPTALCMDFEISVADGGTVSVTPDDIDDGSEDNCEIVTREVTPNEFDCDDVGTQVVVLTVTDASGNSSTCSANVEVVDNEPPIAVCNNVEVTLNDMGMASVTVFDIDGGSSDNCAIDTIFLSEDTFDCSNIGPNPIDLIVFDVAGNSDTCEAIVTVLEEPPTAICQDAIVYLDQDGMASITPADINNNSTDDCGIMSIEVDPSTFGCDDLGSNPVVLTVTDISGNIDTCEATVTVSDTLAPMCVMQDVTVFLDNDGEVTIMSSIIDGGSTDNCTVTDLEAVPMSFTCDDLGNQSVDLIVSDAMGNMDTCTAIVTVLDTIDPICLTENITLQLDAMGNASITDIEQINNGSTDNCTIIDFDLDPTEFNCDNVGANTVTLTVTDQSNNTSSCTATVTIEDPIDPMAICQDASIILDANGMASISPSLIDNGSTDNCDDTLDLSLDIMDFTCDEVGENTVILTVTDDNGATDTCSAIVMVSDDMDPNALCMDAVVMLDANGMASITAADVDGGSGDNCDFTLSVIPTTFDCDDVGSTPVVVTLTVTDASNNTATCTANVTVLENVDPDAVCQNITVQLDGAGMATIVAADVDGGSTDNCDDFTLSATPLSFDCSNLGTNEVVLTVTDAAGNSDTCTAIVTVEDNVDPVALCMNDTVYVDAAGNANIVASDINNGSTDNCGNPTVSVEPTMFDCDDVDNPVTVVLTATDASGNTDTCQAFVTVLDTIPPTIIPNDTTIVLGPSGMVTITIDDVVDFVDDNCDTDTTATPLTFDCSNIGNNNVTITATDPSGNTTVEIAVVTIEENSGPNAVCVNDTVYLDEMGNASITPADIDGGSTDNCDDPTLTVDPMDFTCVNVGLNDVVLTATDGAMNSDTCQAVVTVLDTISPVAECADIDVFLDDNGDGNITINDINDGSSDNCPGAITEIDISSFDCDDLGLQLVILTITDASGNTDTCQSNVTVMDTIDPTCIAQDLNLMLDGNGMVVITAEQIDNGSTDNCLPVSLSIDTSMFDCTDAGANIVTLTVTDLSGNSAMCTATVTIEDAAPMATCMDANIFLDENGMVTLDPSSVDGGSGSNCGDLQLAVTPNMFDCDDVGDNNIVTLTVTDGVGNTSTCTATVTVLDTIDPTCVAQDINVFLDENGMVSITADDIDNNSDDNCDFTLSLTPTDFICTDTGSNTVILTVTDASNNTSTCDAEVIVADTTSPTCMVTDIEVSLDGNGNVMITVNDVNDGSFDNCSPITFGLSPTSFTCDNLGANDVVLTAQDPSGNVSVCSLVVTVIDESNLVANCQNIIVQLDENGVATITADDIDTGSGGGCTGGNIELMLDQTDFDCSETGINVVTLTVTDQDMNTATCQANVNVIDNVLPDILCPADAEVSCNDLPDLNDLSSFGTPITSDNCGVAGVVETPVLDIDDCGVGTIIRTFVVTDVNNNTDVCTQTITVVNPDPFGIDNITFPPALFELDDCASTDPDDIPNSQPILDISSESCSNVTVTFTDQTTNNIDNDPNTPCIEIIRTFRIVDSCQFVPGSTNGIFEFQQTIRVQDNTAPIFNNLNDVEITDQGLDCVEFINLVASATDCGAVTVTNDSPFAFNGGADASGNYPFGTTVVTFTAVDQCGNISTLEVTVRINQEILPSFMCAKVIFELPVELEIFIHAIDFVTTEPGSCSGGSESVLFSYSNDNPFDSIQRFDCSDVGVQTFPLYFYDLDGVLFDSCATADLDLRDENDDCMNGFAISGQVENEAGLPIEDASVMIEDMPMEPAMTSEVGTYLIEELGQTGAYQIIPERNTSHTEGVSTLDLVAIQKHLLGIKPLDSPYKLIAADANNSGKVSGLDLLEIRKLILGIYTEFPNNESWRFVDGAFIFPDPYNPWMIPFPETVVLNELQTQTTLIDFVGLKVGDVNSSFFSSVTQTPVVNRSNKGLLSIDRQTIDQSWTQVLINFGQTADMIGMQWALQFSDQLEWEIDGAHHSIDASNILNTENQLRLSWNEGINQTFLEGEMMVRLRVRSKSGKLNLAHEIQLEERQIVAEYYEDGDDIAVHPMTIVWNGQTQNAAEEFALFQNQPNPFEGTTSIGFNLPAESQVILRVHQANGQEVLVRKGQFSAGRHQMEVNADNFNAEGIYYYSIETDGFSATRKMFIIK